MAYTAQGRTKNFPVFDCDSHIHEPREVWDEYIPEKQRAFAKQHFYRDMDRLVMVVNGQVSYGNPKTYAYPGQGWHPGMNKKILGSIAPDDPRWDEEIGRNASQRDPQVRLKDMDASGIDQVMVFPSTFVRMPLVKNPDAARICATAYNDWVNDYCAADRKRLYPCAVLPVQDVDYAVQELRRVAKLGFKSAVVRPVLVNDRYPTFPEFDPLWKEFEELGLALGMHTFPSGGEAVTEAMAERMSGGIRGKSSAQRSPFTAHDVYVYSPGQFVENIMRSMGSVQPGSESLSFISEAQTWTMVVMLTGWLEKFPKLRVAILESNSSWLPLILEKAETYLDLYRFVREQAKPPQKVGDPRETFARQCFIAFESDEDITLRLWDIFEDIALWSSDMPHHDASDTWEAVDNMDKHGVPQEVQEKMLGGNARRLYGIEPELFVTEAPAEYTPTNIVPRYAG